MKKAIKRKRKMKIDKSVSELISKINPLKKTRPNLKWINQAKEINKKQDEKDEKDKIEAELSNIKQNNIDDSFHETLEPEGNFAAPIIPVEENNNLAANVTQSSDNLETTANEFISTTSTIQTPKTQGSIYASNAPQYAASNTYDAIERNYDSVNQADMAFLGSRSTQVSSPFDTGSDIWSHRIRDSPIDQAEFNRFARTQEEQRETEEDKTNLPFGHKRRKTEIF